MYIRTYVRSTYLSTLVASHCSPLHLSGVLVLARLGLHGLDLNRVGFAATHVQLVVANAQCKDALVDAQARGVEHKVLQQVESKHHGSRLVQQNGLHCQQ